MRRSIRISFIFALLACFAAGPVYAGTCSSPAGKEADIIYNSAYHTYQFCNGTSWIPYQFGYSWGSQANFNPTIPPDSGWFVMSQSTWNANLGGLSGANSLCLTELTTNTGWMGYASANSSSQLTSGKVFAFLCDGSTCNNLQPSTTYYFANAGNSSIGGASFATDSSGIGPNDSAIWSAANRFGGTYTMWTNRNITSNTAWLNSSSNGDPCTSGGPPWTSSTDYHSPTIGNTSYSTSSRWNANYAACNPTYNLICFVNP